MFRTREQRSAPLAFGVATAVALAGALQDSSRAQSFTQFPIPSANSMPLSITAGPDGNLWFTESGSDKIGKITTSGSIIEFATIANPSMPVGITAGPDGAIWFTEAAPDKIGRITITGTLSEFNGPDFQSSPAFISPGADGALWFTEATGGRIGRIFTGGGNSSFQGLGGSLGITGGPDGRLWFVADGAGTENVVSEVGALDARFPTFPSVFDIPTVDSTPSIIVTGPDGALWFTESDSNKIGRITTAGVFTKEFVVPTANSQPTGLTVGSDGALWFTEATTNQLGRITTTGTITEFPLPASPTASFLGIAAGPDGALWFTEFNANNIDRFLPPLSGNPMFSAILPSSRSVRIGNTATAFATLLNTGSIAAESCTLVPITTVPASFSFQTTDPHTNRPVGTPNAPVDVPAGQSQSFVIALTVTAPLSPTDVAVGFSCANEAAASIVSGLNTLLLSGSPVPVADVVALAATTNKDGIVDIPGANGAGDFAVATVNVGASGTITASADTGGVTLPVTVTLCETDPETGACTSVVGSSVSTTINTNATPTFGIFVAGNGTVPFLPAVNRVFVRLKDQNGVIRGSTSVAVRTR